MPNKLMQYSFAAGVISSPFYGRSDLEKYGLGLKDADNFFIDPRGGATSRAGTLFVDQIETGSAVRLFQFQYNQDQANNYLLVFTPLKLRFVQDGAFVLEASKAVAGIAGSSVNVVAHGYTTGDLIRMGGRTYVITVTDANHFTTKDFSGVSKTATGATCARVYTITTPYGANAIQRMNLRQRGNTVRICHTSFARRLLTRVSAASWTLALMPTGESTLSAPANIVGTPSAVGTATTNITVTAVDEDGVETALNEIVQVTAMVDYTATTGSLRITWNRVDGAKYYRIYRSLVFPAGAQTSLGQQLGYIGRSYGAAFTDTNIVPDFTITPPIKHNPFVNGAITEIDITNPGAGYTSAPAVAVSGSGSGFVGLSIMETLVGTHGTGLVDSVLIIDAGSGYSSPTVAFSGGGGAGAAATATENSDLDHYPAASIDYGQRIWYAGTEAFPMTLYGSRLDNPYSFNNSLVQVSTDPVELTLDSGEMTPIRSLETLGDNMFSFTSLGVWQIVPSDTGAFSAAPLTLNGIGLVQPLKIEREIIYTLPNGTGCYALRPNLQRGYYEDADVAFYSPDFFTLEQEIVAWAYAREPFRLVWAATADGFLLSFTYVPVQNVYAWAKHSTRGYVRAVESVLEDGISRVYLVVERDGGLFIERMAHRIFSTVDDIWGVDCALETQRNYPAAALGVSTVGGVTTCTASAAVFSSGDVGKMIRAGGGRGVISSYTSTTIVTLDLIMPIEARKPQSTDSYPTFAEGEWSLDATFTTVSGLDHLEGESVEVLGDGSPMGTYTVASGAITLDTAASYVIVGLPYTGFIETLPPSATNTVIDDKLKRVVGVALRLERSRGVQYGVDTNYYALKERTNENYSEPTRFQSGLKNATVRADWDNQGNIRVGKAGPAAVSLLGLIYDLELGSDDQ